MYDSICYLIGIPGDKPPCAKMVSVNEIRLDLRTDTDSNSAIKKACAAILHQHPSVHLSASHYVLLIAMCT